MLQLRCILMAEEDRDTDDQAFLLDLAIDPARLLFTLNVCRLMLPPDTDPLHIENWCEIESLVRQLSIVYKRTRPRLPLLRLSASQRHTRSRRRRQH